MRIIPVIMVFFLLSVAIGIVLPVTALDEENQTLIDSLETSGYDCFYNEDYSCTWTAFETAHQIDPENYEVLFSHGLLLSQSGNNTGALEKMDAALDLNPFKPEDAWMWKEKGKFMNSIGRYFESGFYYDRAELLDPGYQAPIIERFPLNILSRNAMVITIIIWLFLLGFYIYFNEKHHK